MATKSELIQQLNYLEQERGNLTVLFTNSISAQIGLSATEFECLDIIGEYQPITAGQLASFTGLSTGGITGVVDRLESAGFVRRKRDPKDRRRVLLEQISDKKTVQKIIRLYKPMSTQFEKMASEFSVSDLEVVARYERAAIHMIHTLLGHDEVLSTSRRAPKK